MVTIKRDKTGWASARRVLMGVTLLWVVSSPVLADEQSDIQDELKFASELVKWRLTDYAQKSLSLIHISEPTRPY